MNNATPTPICDFVRRYAASGTVRLHMPGHKGISVLGAESLDITEVRGADSLYEADGIIAQSERIAGELFGAQTVYSTEGSSQCIRAMLYLAAMHARAQGIARPRILAARNAHKTFLSAVALLDLDVTWLYPTESASYLSCPVTAAALELLLREDDTRPTAVYVTSPDYLGHTLPLAALAAVCHRYGVLLLVDNAHGAYLKFLTPSRHPMDAGADMCCDSAHKTLPVLTGGAYLHVAHGVLRDAPALIKRAMACFGSTSPSYLILQSLDAANAVLSDPAWREQLAQTAAQVAALRDALTEQGIDAATHEPLKLTLSPRAYGYTGEALADVLRQGGIECEFADPDFVVLMFTPANTAAELAHLREVLSAVPRRAAVADGAPPMCMPQRVMSVREAMLSPCETLPAARCVGRVLAAATVGCPPAVPIVVSGERIERDAVAVFAYYGIETCDVVREHPACSA